MGWSEWRNLGSAKFIGSGFYRYKSASGLLLYDSSSNSTTMTTESLECDNFKISTSSSTTGTITLTIKKTGIYDIIAFSKGTEAYKLINTKIESGQTFTVSCGNNAVSQGFLTVNAY